MLSVLSQSFRIATRTDGWHQPPMVVVPAAWQRPAHRSLRDLLHGAGRRLVRRRAARKLLEMNDHVLADLNMTRADALELVRRGGVTARRN
jgi:uncharacterized protein YjiS (DUF1127 family)